MDTAIDERMYETVYDEDEVRKGEDGKFGQSASKEPACLPGGLELGVLIICQYDGYG